MAVSNQTRQCDLHRDWLQPQKTGLLHSTLSLDEMRSDELWDDVSDMKCSFTKFTST